MLMPCTSCFEPYIGISVIGRSVCGKRRQLGSFANSNYNRRRGMSRKFTTSSKGVLLLDAIERTSEVRSELSVQLEKR